MMWLKACPRCRGDLFKERNVGDSSMVCLQCGHVLSKSQEEVLRTYMVRHLPPPNQLGAVASEAA